MFNTASTTSSTHRHQQSGICKDAPTFKQLAKQLADSFSGCDFAGYNSNRFDIPLLAEEFLRAGIDFDFSRCHLIDVQNIFFKMEPRNLAAAYKFYTGHSMEEDLKAHRADQARPHLSSCRRQVRDPEPDEVP